MTDYELFEGLLRAEDEGEVVTILERSGYGLSVPSVWQPLGNNEGNFSVVGNQQENPSAAFVEKVINGIDAVLIGACHEAHVDPESADAPGTMQSAVETFFRVPDGRLDSLTAKQRTELAERVHVVATGSKTSPCYLVIDTGEGQTPEQFPHTFVSASQKSPKARVHFVQGKFNAGSTGSLQFCGRHNFQLIVSRRQPYAPAPNDSSRDLWGFTVVRRKRASGGERSSVFVYLAPGGLVPRFAKNVIPALPSPSSKNSPCVPYAEPLAYGTCVKLYNYRWKANSLATREMRLELERNLQKPILPIRVSEAREGYRANFYTTTVSGVWNTIAVDRDTDTDEDSGKMEPGFPASAHVAVRDVGDLPLTIGVWKESLKERHLPTGVFFLVNGQVHGMLTGEFTSRRLKFDYLREDLLVAVDCAGIDRSIAEDLFMPSRDRLRGDEHYTAIREALAQELGEHPGLRELNAQRRRVRAEQRAEDPEEIQGLISRLIRSDPSLARLFGEGNRLHTLAGVGPPVPFKGRKFPTYFKLEKAPKGGMVKHCPINRTARVVFETDAENEYFDRPNDAGVLSVYPTLDLVESSHLWNGKFAVRFRVPWNAKPGETTKVRVEVTDVERSNKAPFLVEFELVADPAEEPGKKAPGGKRSSPAPSAQPNRPAPLKALPNPIPVREADLEKNGFSGVWEALRIKRADQGLDFYVNVDNPYLKSEAADRKNDPATVKYWFMWGLTIAAFAMVREQEERAEREKSPSPEESVDYEAIGRACDGIARVIVPIVRTLHGGPESAVV
jgi:hypothetical protein